MDVSKLKVEWVLYSIRKKVWNSLKVFSVTPKYFDTEVLTVPEVNTSLR